MQVSEAIFRYGRTLGVRVVPIYGGQPIFRQLQALDRGVEVVVGTPGRVLDHIGRGSLPLDAVRIVVLDEADEMLDMGFADDIESILESVPEERQTLLFSATMPPAINGIAKRYLREPVRIAIGARPTRPPTAGSSPSAPTSCPAPTSRPRSAASSTWSRRRRRSCSAVPGPRSTS